MCRSMRVMSSRRNCDCDSYENYIQSIYEIRLHFLAYFVDQGTIGHWIVVDFFLIELPELLCEEISLFLVLFGPTQTVLILQSLCM